jgi:tetratricopeptide (TPR) repeat protein
MRIERLDIGISLLLAAVTVVAFVPAFGADFVAIDDPVYVSRNRHVVTGLTAENAGWAWTTFCQSNWHPLTWLSLQLDATLWKSANGDVVARGFHTTNVVVHAANAALLFFVLGALTGERWKSAAAAALFAAHPLRVESVAWVSERKDVLSLFFGLLALWAYSAWTRNRTAASYAVVTGALILSLLSKPMLVTFPCLLLVLDWWPLGRVKTAGGWRPLVVEKLPWFALCLASSVVTFEAQQFGGSVRGLAALPFDVRIESATVAYATYLWKTVWPINLAPFYPYPDGGWPGWQAALSTAVLLALTLLAIQQRQRPYLLAGWLWFVGTLVPVIGLVQVGSQAFADRYTYFPSIGLYIALVWATADLVAWKKLRVACAIAAVLALAALTWRQSGFWNDDITLWPHTLQVTGPNAQAYSNVGIAYENRGELSEAIKYYALAVETNPGYGTARYNLARTLKGQGRVTEAIEHYRAALRADPRLSDAHNDLGTLLNGQGRIDDAEREFREAVRIDPESAVAHRNLGSLLENRGRDEEALAHYEEAARWAPDDGPIQERLGIYFGRRKQYDRAIGHLMRAADLQPESGTAQRNAGVMLDKLGRHDEAIACFRRAVEKEPKSPINRVRLATALARRGDTPGAQDEYAEALRLSPQWPDDLAAEAWRRATSPDPRQRDGAAAVWSAESVCNAVRPPPAKFLDALAAAYAEANRFAEAMTTAEKAIAAARAGGNTELANAIADRLTLYRAGRAFRDGSVGGGR